MGVCIKCWVDLFCIVEQRLLHVPDVTYCELLEEEVARWGKGSEALGKESSGTFVWSWLPINVLCIQTGMLGRGCKQKARNK